MLSEAKHLSEPRTRRRFRAQLLAWFRVHGRDLPWRRMRDPYAILVSELMLQQTQVATVIPYFERWLARFPDVASLAAADESEVLHAWQGLGYYARARNLHAAGKTIVRDHSGIFPRSTEAIRALPGVGRYTAHAVATFAFDSSLPIVEANIARLLARLTNLQLAIDSTAGRDSLWRTATEFLPARRAFLHNSALMDLGALVCTPRDPKCAACPVRSFCHCEDVARLPIRKAKPPTIALTEHHSFSLSRSRVLLEQSETRWRGMWILPRTGRSVTAAPIHTSTFQFTHHAITLNVFPAAAPIALAPPLRWFRLSALDSVPMPSPHRRALTALLQLDVGR